MAETGLFLPHRGDVHRWRYAWGMTPSTTTAELPPPAALDPSLRGEWVLDPAITFLNHGSFGARPVSIVAAQQKWREAIEASPVEHLGLARSYHAHLETPKRDVGRFLHMDPDGFGFVTNATEGVNTVLRSLRLDPGDELLTTTHVYNAVRNAMRYVAEVAGGRYVEVNVPFPCASADVIVEAIAGALTERTRLLVVDHVSSPTALVFPVERLCALCRERGIEVLVDGAHAPGMLDLNVEAIGATYYTGNLHKWVCAPLGTAILWVCESRRDRVHPNTISHLYEEGMAREFAWQGTRDHSNWLVAGTSVNRLDADGWAMVRQYNHDLAMWAHAMLCRRWGVEPATPLDGSLLGSMATIAWPDAARVTDTPDELTSLLFERHRIEVPVLEFNDRWWIRISAQAYNTPEHYERLADAVESLKRA